MKSLQESLFDHDIVSKETIQFKILSVIDKFISKKHVKYEIINDLDDKDNPRITIQFDKNYICFNTPTNIHDWCGELFKELCKTGFRKYIRGRGNDANNIRFWFWNSINESLFDDNINSDITINGVKIYDPDWKKCEEFFEKRRNKYFKGKDKIDLGDMKEPYVIVYNEKDCVVAIGEDDGGEIYILSPETIYMNHVVAEAIYGRRYAFSLDKPFEANDFEIEFQYRLGAPGHWAWLSGCYSSYYREIAMDRAGINQDYMPVTISDKAKSIIKKYM